MLLISGWTIRIVSGLFLADKINSNTLYVLNSFGKSTSGASVFFLFGGILFYALISSRQVKEAPESILTEAEQKQQMSDNLATISDEIKNSVPFTAVYGIMSILLLLIGLSTAFVNKEKLGWSAIIVGALLSQYYIRKSIRQIKWLIWYKKQVENSRR